MSRASRRLIVLAALMLVTTLAGCGDTGNGYGSVQGGTGRAPGAPPAGQATVRATATTPR